MTLDLSHIDRSLVWLDFDKTLVDLNEFDTELWLRTAMLSFKPVQSISNGGSACTVKCGKCGSSCTGTGAHSDHYFPCGHGANQHD